MRPPRALLAFSAVAALSLLGVSPVLRVQAQVTPTASGSAAPESSVAVAEREAAQAFTEGAKAFNAGDYALAGQLFERAYALAAHPSVSWNAAQAWSRAGEPVRAANLFDRYLREAPAEAPDRDRALAELRALAPQVARLDLYFPGVRDVHVDATRVESSRVYVAPGQHVIWGRVGDQIVRSVRDVAAGSTHSVVLSLEAVPSASASPSSKPPPPSSAPSTTAPVSKPARPLSPTVVFVGAGLTLIAGGFTLWSGLDTWKARDRFDSSPSQQSLDQGLEKQNRTNVLSYVTLGCAALTGVAALWLVDWPARTGRTSVGLGPGSAHVRIAF